MLTKLIYCYKRVDVLIKPYIAREIAVTRRSLIHHVTSENLTMDARMINDFLKKNINTLVNL